MLIGYARVSTVDQDPALQRDALKRAGCEKIFEETASGAKVDRPQLARALEHMRKGDTLVVWKLDRLARSMKQLIETVGCLEAAGVKFRSITENVGTDSAGGRFVFHIFGALAEFERSLIRERTQAGLNAARARGRKGGRPKAMSADDLAVANSLLAAKREPDEVARRLGVSPRTLYRHLAEAKKTPPQKKIAKASNDLAAFAVAIKRVLKGRSTKPLRKKVAIAEAYEISGRKELDVGTLDAFKKRLAAAAREGLIELERCDVVGVLPATVLKSSRTQFGRDERHLIVTEGL